MKRRQFISAAGAAAVAAGGFPAPAFAQGRKELKLVTSWPKNYPGQGTAANRLAARIAEATEGQITVKVFAAGELVPAFEVFDAVAGGAADIYHSAEYYFQGKSRAFAFFSTVPFGMTTAEHTAWIRYGGGQQVWDELSAGFGIKPFLGGNTGVQMGGWFRKEINAVEDFKGLKFRMPGLGGDVLKKLGVTVLAIPAGEIFAALQSGAIDGTEWVGPWNDLALGLYKVAKHYYWPGIHEPGAALGIGVNLKVWEGLTKSQRTIMEAMMQAENDLLYAEYNARNGEAVDTLVNKHRVQLKRFPDEVLKALGNAAGEVVAEVGAADAQSKKVYESFIKFRKSVMEWTRLSDQAFTGARALEGIKYG